MTHHVGLVDVLRNLGLQLEAGELGDGGFATVYKALDTQRQGAWPVSQASRASIGPVYAVKLLNFVSHRGQPLTQDRAAMTRQSASCEIRALTDLRHVDGIATLHQAIEKPDFAVLVLQFCEGGDLCALDRLR